MNIEFFLPPPPISTARKCFDFFGKNGWHLNVIDSNGICDQCRRSKSIMCGVSVRQNLVLLVLFVFFSTFFDKIANKDNFVITEMMF